jgi:MFS family permease
MWERHTGDEPRGVALLATTRRAAVRRLAVARLISLIGTDASAIALGFLLYSRTGSAGWLAGSLLITVGLGSLLAPLGGLVGDRFDRRRTMVATEVAAAGLFVCMAVLDAPAALLATSLGATMLGAVFGPVSTAAIPAIAGERELARANAWITTGANVGKTAGRLLGGAITAALGPDAVFLLDAATFLGSAALIASVRLSFDDGRELERGARGRLVAGFRHLTGEGVLRAVTAAACVSTFMTSFSMTAEIPLALELGGGAMAIGLLTASWGIGMVAGSSLAGRRLHERNEITGVLVGRVLMGAGIALVAAMPVLAPALACYVLGGLGGGFMGVAAQSLVQRNTPDRLRGRVFGALDGVRNLAFAAGVAGAGVLVGPLGARPTYAIVGLGVILGVVPLYLVARERGGLRSLRPAAA